MTKFVHLGGMAIPGIHEWAFGGKSAMDDTSEVSVN